jgi:UDP-N-acetylmuramate dehydrogenase
MNILNNISLKAYNTFGIDCKVKNFVSIRNEKDIKVLYKSDITLNSKCIILGEGSNVLFVGDFDGLVIHNEIKGYNIIESNNDFIIIEAGAGEKWHDFVSLSINNGYSGLENLALIPGTVGSAAIQNIGAYGVEQNEFIDSAYGFNIEKHIFQRIYKINCNYGYRDSIFKNELKDKFIISSVRYKLSKSPFVNYNYKDIINLFKEFNITNPTPMDIFKAVISIRNEKLPDWRQLGNSGSFFKNPIVNKKIIDDLKSKFQDIPIFPQTNNLFKLSAAWMIEQTGWKGFRVGDAGVYEKHALILVNHGNASGESIFQLSMDIRKSVKLKFNIELEPEVLIISN